MYRVQIFNKIREAGLRLFPTSDYQLGTDFADADVILLRSHSLHDTPLPKSIKAVGRAGAGVNNIPVAELSQRGVPVFNTPGANANAVKELVLAGMLLSARNLIPAWQYTRDLGDLGAALEAKIEAAKREYVGSELPNRTLGVIGLGAIGGQVANAAERLGMNVVGYDPHITVDQAWQLSAKVEQVRRVESLLARSDYVTLHVPMAKSTQHLVNAQNLRHARRGMTLLNFARAGVVDPTAILAALDEDRLRAYVCDFPTRDLIAHRKVIALPHLGASTEEAEENCAKMVVNQVRDYFEHGIIRNSVNFPTMDLPTNGGCRFTIAHANVPHMIEGISAAISRLDINIVDMLNRSREELACTVVDLECPAPPTVIDEIRAIDGVLSVYSI